jgi:rSAM/selenodomain-associated transferase 1
MDYNRARMSREGVAIVIMAKAPRAGAVKTRLCPPLSPADAADLYACFLRDKIAQVQGVTGVTGVIAFTPGESRSEFELLAPGFRLIEQLGADLGERLRNCLDGLLGDAYAGAVAIDSDTPTLPTAFLEQAVSLLSGPGADVVVGPSDDGGYYLIGVRRPAPFLFERMPWSTPAVLPETLRRAEAKGLQVARLPVWFDVDTPADLDRLRAELAGGDGPPIDTREFFARRR